MAEGARGLKKPGLAWTWSHAPECSCSSQGRASHAARGAARQAQKGPKAKARVALDSPGLLRSGWRCARQSNTAPCCHALPGCSGAVRVEKHGAVLLRPGHGARPRAPCHGATARPRTLLCTTTRRRAVSLSWLATGCSALGARCSVQQHGAVLFFICRKGAPAPELRSRWPRAVLKGLILEPACGAREGLASLAPKREANREATHQEA